MLPSAFIACSRINRLLVASTFLARFEFDLRWAIPAWRLPGATLWETLLLGDFLVRRITGRGSDEPTLHELDYRARSEKPRAVARRASMILRICLTPNTYVAAVDRERQVLLLHQLVGNQLTASDEAFLELR